MARITNPIRFIISTTILLAMLVFGGYKLIEIGKGFLGYDKVGFDTIGTIVYKEDESFLTVPFKENIVIYNEGRLSSFNEKGEEIWQLEQKIEEPLLKSSKGLLFLGDKKTGILHAIDEKGSKAWSFEMNFPMKGMVCNNKGESALYASKPKGGEVILLDQGGKQQGVISLSKGYIIDLALEDEEDMLAMSILDVENNNLNANVVLYSKKGKLLGGNQYGDEVISHIFFSKEHKLINVGIKKLVGFSKEQGLLWSKDISGSIDKLAWSPEGFLALSLLHHKKSIIEMTEQNYIVLIDMNGEIYKEIPMKTKVLAMDAIGNQLAAVDSRTLYVFQEDSQIEKKIHNDIKGVQILSKDKIMVILKNKIEIMGYKQK